MRGAESEEFQSATLAAKLSRFLCFNPFKYDTRKEEKKIVLFPNCSLSCDFFVSPSACFVCVFFFF